MKTFLKFFKQPKHLIGLGVVVLLGIIGLFLIAFPGQKALAATNITDQATWQNYGTIIFQGDTYTGPTLINNKYVYKDTSTSNPTDLCIGVANNQYAVWNIYFNSDPTKQGNNASTGFFTGAYVANYQDYKNNGVPAQCENAESAKVTLNNPGVALYLLPEFAACAQNNAQNRDLCIRSTAHDECQREIDNFVPGPGKTPPDLQTCINQKVQNQQNAQKQGAAGGQTNQDGCLDSFKDKGCLNDPGGGSGTSKDDPTGCDFNGDPLTWIICPVVKMLEEGIQWVDNFITSALTFDTCAVFDPNCAKTSGGKDTYQGGFYTAFGAFRTLAIAVLIIAGLVMVSSQALGFEFLDAYTMKKVLPRIVIAIIALTLAWPLMQFAIDFFNTFGKDIRELIYSPFDTNIKGTLGASTLFVFGAGFGVLFGAMGPAILTFLLTAALAVLVGFLIIMVRYLAILVLIIFAPIAIVCYVLPNTQKVWNLWRENFIGMLLVYPIISAFIAIGHVFSAVSTGGGGPGTFLSGTAMQAIGFIAYFLPYFLLPIAFRMATGVIGSLAGFVNDRHRGAFDRLKGMRGNAVKQRHQMRMSEQMSKGAVGNVYRRMGSITTPQSGALSFTRQGRANYAELQRKRRLGQADEGLKNDNGRAAGMDDATSLAVQGMNRSRFIQEYQRMGHSATEANAALATLERGFGAQMGSDTMRVAAFKARAGSTTAYAGGEAGTVQRFNEGAALLNAGLMTDADLTSAGKGNRGRTDINGAGYNTQMTAFRNAAASLRGGGGGMNAAGAHDYLRQTLQEADPGDILAGNTRTIDSLAPIMRENLMEAIQRRDAAGAAGNMDAYHDIDVEVNRHLGQIAGIQDNLNRTSPQKAGLFADNVNSVEVRRVDGTRTTVRQLVDEAANRPADDRGVQTFLAVRKEFGSRRALSPGEEAAARMQPEPREEG